MAESGLEARGDRPAAFEYKVLRVGAASAVVGPVLAIVVNILHPRPSTSDVGEHETYLRLASDSDTWVPVHVGLIAAFILLLAGLAAVSYSLRDERTAWLARSALAAALVGGAVGLVQASTDLAARWVAEDWQAAPAREKPVALRVGAMLEDVDFALLSVELVVFFGLAFVLYGLAVAASGRYPSWIGWVAVAAGGGGVVVGVAQAFLGRASLVTLIGIPVVAAAISLWLLVIGVLLWRQTATGA